VRLNDKDKTATLVAEQVHSPALTASFEGNVQPLPDGNVLQAVATVSTSAFESQVTIPAQPYVAVQALDGAGRRLATSSVAHAA
jgi:hypothetical protein